MTHNHKDGVEPFKNFMILSYPQYTLISSTENTLYYRLDIPAKSANCATAGCLLFLGILPGILYFLLTSTNAKSYTLQYMYNKANNTYSITGNTPDLNYVTHYFGKYLNSI